MKTIPPSCPEPEVGAKYWRSLDQLADTPEFRQWVEREFPSGASEFNDPVSRRHFAKIMSASFMLAGLGLAGCRKPEEHILPFSKKPQGYVHGVPQFYATARPTRSSAVPLLVKSHDGRPIKVEGNPKIPGGNGGTDTYTQASILNLYDPDRAMRFAKGGATASRDEAFAYLSETSAKFAANGGAGLAFLVERSSSPSRERLQKAIAAKFPKAKWHVFEPVDLDIHRKAATLACGRGVRPDYRFENARRIVSLDCDFIGAEQEAYRYIRGFANGRKLSSPNDEINRLYVIEGLFSLTGTNADHRLRVAPSHVVCATARLLQEIAGGDAGSHVQRLAAEFKGDAKWIVECAKDRRSSEKQGKSLILAGHQQPLEVHWMALAINQALGNLGSTVAMLPAPIVKEGSIEDLAASLNAGQVDTLVMLGVNPAYTAPVDLEWSKAQAKAKAVIRWAYYEDESAAGVTWHLPAAHYLESWGDARSGDGTLVPVQPLIEPLFGGVTDLEVLARLAGLDVTKPYEIVRETFGGLISNGNFEENWKKFLHTGFWPGSALKPVKAAVNLDQVNDKLATATVAPLPSTQQLEVIFHRDNKVDDGRYNNNGWLQELPDPITKMTWENVILMSPKTAKALGLEIKNRENNQLFVPVVKIQVNGKEIEGPAWTQPGQADNTVALALGYGRNKTGRVGHGSGYDAYQVRVAATPHIATGAKLSDTKKTHGLATTQDHWAMEGRPIVREANLKQYQEHPNFARFMNLEEPPIVQSMYPNPLDARKKDALHQWGMVIDLNACVGCSACSIACQSENNIPIVGKEQVTRHREMHWLRIDRYFTSDPKLPEDQKVDDPQVVMQPMLCQHCEAAPCENVCPVNATVHDEEGLNLMVYNRCVGTRYCSNNCPYKVRRFNFFDYNKRTPEQLKGPFYPNPVTGEVAGEWGVTQWLKDPAQGYRTGDEWDLLKMSKNPDVSVRMRGVMEKCTFCVQRLEQAKISKKIKAGASGDVRLKESEGNIPQTACQQACPAGAIVFGDVSDPQSQVSQQKANSRDYAVLEFLLTKPRLTYLAKVRNPNPEMPDYREYPLSVEEYSKAAHANPFESHSGAPAADGKGHEAHGSKKGAH